MTPIEWIALTQLVIIPIAVFIWKEIRSHVRSEKVKSVFDTAVRAAEELAAADVLPETKEEYVTEVIERELPWLDPNKFEALLHEAVQAAGVGASAKA